MTQQTHAVVAGAREEFLELVRGVRPELHRYCARLTGSIIEGEDIVQETLARAFYALGLDPGVPALRPWLFRIAHNAALDYLKSHGRKFTEVRDDLADVAGFDEGPDLFAVRAALARFLALPVSQRSAVILKDVLGHSLEETAETMATSVMDVKAALVRGRAKLREAEAAEAAEMAGAPAQATTVRADLDRYVARFNARDWDGVRALVGDDCRLDLVSKARRRGKDVGAYFGRYAKEDVSLRVVELEGRLALAAHVAGAAQPSYFMLLAWEDGRIKDIRDFRYVEYIAAEAAVGEA
jgi:RNA polymerase sigma factor (sigma-70 family)